MTFFPGSILCHISITYGPFRKTVTVQTVSPKSLSARNAVNAVRGTSVAVACVRVKFPSAVTNRRVTSWEAPLVRPSCRVELRGLHEENAIWSEEKEVPKQRKCSGRVPPYSSFPVEGGKNEEPFPKES